MLDIQLVVADIDGTFLDSESKPSKGAREAIDEIRRQGIKFTLCSGRGDAGVRPFVAFLGLDQPYITSGGAVIFGKYGKSVIWRGLMSAEQIERAVQLGLATASDLLLHTARQIYGFTSDEFWEDIRTWEWMKGYGLQEFRRVKSWQDAPLKEIVRMDFFNQSERLPQLAQDVSDLNVGLHATVMRRNVEITDRKVDKGSALTCLAKYLHIPMENVMSVGDGMNDIGMLEKAGIGVAMRNSSPEVILKANYVAPSCDEGGLAWTLHQLLAGKLSETKLSWME